jgi:hypothetical protein
LRRAGRGTANNLGLCRQSFLVLLTARGAGGTVGWTAGVENGPRQQGVLCPHGKKHRSSRAYGLGEGERPSIQPGLTLNCSHSSSDMPRLLSAGTF